MTLEADYLEFINKFVNKRVVIADDGGNRYKGLCKAVNFPHLNVILVTEEANELTVVRNVRFMKIVKEELMKK
jgi:small nuclear ribonucleoprotein (snRNP)-like protein